MNSIEDPAFFCEYIFFYLLGIESVLVPEFIECFLVDDL